MLIQILYYFQNLDPDSLKDIAEIYRPPTGGDPSSSNVKPITWESSVDAALAPGQVLDEQTVNILQQSVLRGVNPVPVAVTPISSPESTVRRRSFISTSLMPVTRAIVEGSSTGESRYESRTNNLVNDVLILFIISSLIQS